jgi:hypothetical protein
MYTWEVLHANVANVLLVESLDLGSNYKTWI